LIKLAGVLLAPLGQSLDKEKLEKFCIDFPIINFDLKIEGMGDSFICHNNEQETAVMTEYLTRSSDPPVLFEMRNPPNPNARKRTKAYIKIMNKLALKTQIIKIYGNGWEFEKIGY